MSTESNRPPRIAIHPQNPAAGERVRVRAMAQHNMETGLRRRATGEPIPRNIINIFRCTYDGQLLFEWELDTAVSPNPYLEFHFVAHQSGELNMRWEDEEGQVIEASRQIVVA